MNWGWGRLCGDTEYWTRTGPPPGPCDYTLSYTVRTELHSSAPFKFSDFSLLGEKEGPLCWKWQTPNNFKRFYASFFPKQVRDLWKGDPNFCNHDWKSSRNPRIWEKCWKPSKLAYLWAVFKNRKFSLVALENAEDCVSGLLYSPAQLTEEKGFSKVLKGLIVLNILSVTGINFVNVNASH